MKLNVFNLPEVVKETNAKLSSIASDIQNKFIRKGIVEAGQIQRQALAQNLAPYRGTKPAVGKLRGSRTYVSRPRLASSVQLKIWRSPSGGYMAISGPVAIEVPHGHWFERGTKRRETKTGQNRGVMFSRRGGPPFAFSRAFQATQERVVSAFVNELNVGINSLSEG